MRTDELIEALTTNLEPTDRAQVKRGLGTGVALAVAAALGLALLSLGMRPDLRDPGALTFLVVKLAFSLGVVAVAATYLARLALPGGERKAQLAITAVPFAAAVLLATFSLASAQKSHWEPMIFGRDWLECAVVIPLVAVVPFLLMVRAVRKVAAPTDLVRTGALVGMLAGGLGAMGYALHCTDDSLPFVALWYGGTVALCALAGAVLGPRLLRW